MTRFSFIAALMMTCAIVFETEKLNTRVENLTEEIQMVKTQHVADPQPDPPQQWQISETLIHALQAKTNPTPKGHKP